jgi:hypothetical protein
MKATITRSEYLQLLGLLTLIAQAERARHSYHDAVTRLLGAESEPPVGSPFGHIEDLMFQGAEGDYTDVALNDSLRKAGIAVEGADPAILIGGPLP